MCGIDYPTSMGITGVATALDVLNGISVPDKVDVNTQIVLSPGADTISVKADRLHPRSREHVGSGRPVSEQRPARGLQSGDVSTRQYPK